jgi:hypothetical protein
MEYKKAFDRDYNFGIQEEEKLIEVFRERFDKCLCKTNSTAIIDFISPKTYLELKSRNCNHNKFNDIMIGDNKIQFALKTKRDVIFAFNFLDGVYFYKFNKDDIFNNKINFRLGGRTDRGKDEIKRYAYISRELLEKI